MGYDISKLNRKGRLKGAINHATRDDIYFRSECFKLFKEEFIENDKAKLREFVKNHPKEFLEMLSRMVRKDVNIEGMEIPQTIIHVIDNFMGQKPPELKVEGYRVGDSTSNSLLEEKIK